MRAVNVLNRAMTLFRIGMFTFALFSSALYAEEANEEHSHSHHVAAATGIAWHDDHSSAYLGVDYLYRLNGQWAVGGFYEEVSGDFNLRAWGLIFNRYFGHGWRVGFGPGAELKLKNNQTLGLLHFSAGYDWHRGSWSFGPNARLDLIEGGKHTYYLGVLLGYGF
jgi:hypothetical protein